jgi:hypothetical protein
MLAARMGQLDKAKQHFDYAIRRSRDVGFRPTLALVLADYSDALLA